MSDKLFFYSKSADKKPGKGVNEVVSDPEKYKELPPNWRRVLSNFHVYPFEFDGYMYNSIEHAFQAKKISLIDPEKAYLFTINSGHPIGTGDGLMAQKNRKLVILDRENIRIWSYTSDDWMEKAAIAKYSQCNEARYILKLTQDAELWHVVSRKKPVRFFHLENIRLT